ncbi:MAG: hypothetical protein ACE5PO_00920 [Candidatus Bathyarchaeia archaeon]
MSRVALRVVRRWIAGETAEEALRRAKKANQLKLNAIVNFLGEHVTESVEASSVVQEYVNLTEAISRRKLRACISVKPSQLGLLQNPQLTPGELHDSCGGHFEGWLLPMVGYGKLSFHAVHARHLRGSSSEVSERGRGVAG